MSSGVSGVGLDWVGKASSAGRRVIDRGKAGPIRREQCCFLVPKGDQDRMRWIEVRFVVGVSAKSVLTSPRLPLARDRHAAAVSGPIRPLGPIPLATRPDAQRTTLKPRNEAAASRPVDATTHPTLEISRNSWYAIAATTEHAEPGPQPPRLLCRNPQASQPPPATWYSLRPGAREEARVCSITVFTEGTAAHRLCRCFSEWRGHSNLPASVPRMVHERNQRTRKQTVRGDNASNRGVTA